jgi:hypothetical protein
MYSLVADFWLGEGTAPPGARTSVWLVPSSQGRSPSNEGFRAKSTVSERTWVLVSVAPAGRGQPETANERVRPGAPAGMLGKREFDIESCHACLKRLQNTRRHIRIYHLPKIETGRCLSPAS